MVSWSTAPLDAIVLAGGQGRRLGGLNKAALIGPDGRTALAVTLDVCWQAGARRVVVVGPVDENLATLAPLALHPGPGDRGPGEATGQATWFQTGKPSPTERRIGLVQEVPPRSGPARAIAAGVAVLGQPAGDADNAAMLVLACDTPGAGAVVPILLAQPRRGEGAVAWSDGHLQWLLGVYAATALRAACQRLPAMPSGRGEPLRSLLGQLDWHQVDVPKTGAEDLDTAADLDRWGFAPPAL